MGIWTKTRNTLERCPAPRWLERAKIQWSRHAITASRRTSHAHGSRRLFIDISVIAKNDAGTGIQRVVRGIALREEQLRHAGWDVWFVCATRKRPYHRINWPHSDNIDLTPIQGQIGDVFLGLDYALDTVRFQERQLRHLAQKGVLQWYLVHDLLPLQRPDWFPPSASLRFHKWLRVLASVSDGYFCNSNQTESDLKHSLSELFGVKDGYVSHVLPMGTDIKNSLHTTGLPDGFESWLERLDGPMVLTVGTLEPRKGHNELLDAFAEIWSRNGSTKLVLVGREGWSVEGLMARIRSHPELGHRLFYFDKASDEALMRLYEACDGVIIPSLAEGYGLPLIEALGYGKPVLARDIEVFRVHENAGVRYFPAYSSPQTFADRILSWMDEAAVGTADVTGVQPITWEDSVTTLLEVLKSHGFEAKPLRGK
ncbi:glycosyltransferase involved in cell wall biosynthesis [Brevundimonas nasdae]|uniref:glycosyltransferase family 4 protein n=1 Tax=Brevundimonas nasdae TaxID=172043 RepID=UPI00191465E4|nr:glycosyltransferase family 1 protein [Brevundimonas nasdae]MBK6025174.1 glycosyltransferase family 4 protein [Brevundimonas nasdae]MDQ0452045.1 glycosyltransferase involved in cell wall biosynthesis [Brevundimonas nasdae]